MDMKLGIKVAPGSVYKRDIEATRPQMVEVWYNASKRSAYDELFAYLSRQKLDVGLHFWGALPTNILANTSYPDLNVSVPSIAQMYATIDVAAEHHFQYVNIHPDMYSLLQVNFDTMDIHVASDQADRTIQNKTFMKNMCSLTNYATSRSVTLTVETVPLRDTPTWRPDRDRLKVIDLHQMLVNVHIDLAAQHVHVANDLCHTACNLITDDRAALWTFLKKTTQTLASATKLVHLGFLAPPYNGVDFHNSLDNPIFTTDTAIPNKSEMIELLKNNFAGRDDVWTLVEPEKDHVKNYFLAREILETAGVLTKYR